MLSRSAPRLYNGHIGRPLRLGTYRIHRLRESARTQFRWAPHTAGLTTVKPKDYQPAGEVEASGPYVAWNLLKDTDDALQPGDVLESLPDGTLCIYKYVGFEQAQWLVQEPTETPDAVVREAPPANV